MSVDKEYVLGTHDDEIVGPSGRVIAIPLAFQITPTVLEIIARRPR